MEELREKRDQLSKVISKEEEMKLEIQKKLHKLTEQLHRLNESLALKQQARTDYDRTVAETEAAYNKIVHSSQTLLHVLKREASNLAAKRIATVPASPHPTSSATGPAPDTNGHTTSSSTAPHRSSSLTVPYSPGMSLAGSQNAQPFATSSGRDPGAQSSSAGGGNTGHHATATTSSTTNRAAAPADHGDDDGAPERY